MRRTQGGASARILKVAEDRFSERGYRGTSIEDIASGAEISRASLFWHFGSKEGLLRSVIEGVLARWVDCIHGEEGGHRGIEATEAALAAIRRLHTEAPSAARLTTVLMGEASSSETGLAPIFSDLARDLIESFSRSLSEAAEDGDLDPALDPGAAARVFVAALYGMAQLWVLDPDRFDKGSLEDDLIQVIQCLGAPDHRHPKRGARSKARFAPR